MSQLSPLIIMALLQLIYTGEALETRAALNHHTHAGRSVLGSIFNLDDLDSDRLDLELSSLMKKSVALPYDKKQANHNTHAGRSVLGSIFNLDDLDTDRFDLELSPLMKKSVALPYDKKEAAETAFIPWTPIEAKRRTGTVFIPIPFMEKRNQDVTAHLRSDNVQKSLEAMWFQGHRTNTRKREEVTKDNSNPNSVDKFERRQALMQLLKNYGL